MKPSLACPICGRKVAANDPNMPFCSDRCRTIDLANWATDKYAIPANAPGEFEDLDVDEDPEGRGQ